MNLKDAFAGIAEAKNPTSQSREMGQPGAREPRRSGTQAPKSLSAEAPKSRGASVLPLQGTAKSRHPEFEAVKIYIRSRTRKAAWRKWEDANGGDFSDLVQRLLEDYLRA